MSNQSLAKLIGQEFENGSWRECFDSGEKWQERIRNSPPLTVVIPVYNGLEYVSRLLNALENAPGIDSIILVDDHCPDARTEDLCAKWAQSWMNRMCIRNIRNLGFVRSVNIGIKAAPGRNDIILLNSDTIPSQHFAQRLKNAAYSQPNVATVTPLSNAAGIFSVPIPKENNVLPLGWSVDQFATLLELVSGAPYEVIPSGSGFCLYITRSAIETVGMFDELLFERGYAEESDFCRRAVKKGLVNLVDMSTFVYHEREISFGAEKIKLKKRNSNILKFFDSGYISTSLEWENSTKLKHLWNCLPIILNNTDETDMPIKLSSIKATTDQYVDHFSATKSNSLKEVEPCIFISTNKHFSYISYFGLKKISIDLNEYKTNDINQYIETKCFSFFLRNGIDYVYTILTAVNT